MVPGTLPNAGGVVVSYFEWAQNWQGEIWPMETVRGGGHEYGQGVVDGVTQALAGAGVASDRVRTGEFSGY